MKTELGSALGAYLLALADDELILAHRNSEWCGHAPILEEDIAFANLALDEMGHALIWYRLLADVCGEDPDRYPDQLVYTRTAPEFRNVQLVEQPKGDWAYTLVRQFVFDAFEAVRLERLVESSYPPLAQAAAKIQGEEFYHLRHTRAWVHRLGLGTKESNRRMQAAIEAVWPDARQLIAPMEAEAPLVAEGIVPPSGDLEAAWLERVRPEFEAAELALPEDVHPRADSRRDHTESLRDLLAELQHVARAFPEMMAW